MKLKTSAGALTSSAARKIISHAMISSAIVLLGGISASYASELTIPGPVSFNNSFININEFSNNTSNSVQVSAPGTQSLDNGSSQAQSTASLNPAPSLNVSGSTSFGQSIGLLNLTYQFEVVGPSTNAVVPILVSAFGNVGGSTTGAGIFGSLQSTLTVGGLGISINQSVGGSSAASWSLNNNNFNFTPNTLYGIQMIAEGSANAGILGGTASFFANVDPVFTIDPTFADANQYSFLFSPGVGNGVSATPLPTSWTMMLIGLAGFGLIAY